MILDRDAVCFTGPGSLVFGDLKSTLASDFKSVARFDLDLRRLPTMIRVDFELVSFRDGVANEDSVRLNPIVVFVQVEVPVAIDRGPPGLNRVEESL